MCDGPSLYTRWDGGLQYLSATWIILVSSPTYTLGKGSSRVVFVSADGIEPPLREL